MNQQVYILEDRNSGLLKIGISIDIAVRVGQINRDFGCDAEVVGILEVENALKTERFIHGMLEDCRVVGEWFEVSARRRNYLMAYFDAAPRQRRTKQVAPHPQASCLGEDRHGNFNWLCEKIRQRMREQPRGYQTLLAEKLGVSRAFINQVVTGVRPLPLEHLDVILGSLNLVYDVALSEFTTEPPSPEPEVAP